MLANALQYSHKLLKEILQPGEIALDATMGNGHDTLFLAELVGQSGHVYAFDLQKKALENTASRLEKAGLEKRASLICSGHENLADYLPEATQVKGAIFNLGYLPQSDKTIITRPATTLAAIKALLPKLAYRGRIVLVCYYGHFGGTEELEKVTNFAANLPQEDYNVLQYQFINQKNQPPILLCIEKKS